MSKHTFNTCPSKGEIAKLQAQVSNGLASKVKAALFLARLNIGMTVALVGAVLGAAYYLVQHLLVTNEALVERLNAAILAMSKGAP